MVVVVVARTAMAVAASTVENWPWRAVTAEAAAMGLTCVSGARNCVSCVRRSGMTLMVDAPGRTGVLCGA
jgi:hypothetical protein